MFRTAASLAHAKMGTLRKKSFLLRILCEKMNSYTTSFHRHLVMKTTSCLAWEVQHQHSSGLIQAHLLVQAPSLQNHLKTFETLWTKCLPCSNTFSAARFPGATSQISSQRLRKNPPLLQGNIPIPNTNSDSSRCFWTQSKKNAWHVAEKKNSTNPNIWGLLELFSAHERFHLL